ncbi:chemotaxis protein CheD [Oceanotoga teriensis]|uniref:Probable chemoreceptor glutamine deamidase CheD n=1 Tax=Oceanotoga teriensis TaxID=515440 RepID=A0AA45HIG3_9BACT|nr:chemotaxis protein CheD [Oceanotoga teriensis]
MEVINTFFVKPGVIFFSEEPYKISTVLGSCVSIAMWDFKNKWGGMNHYMYPHEFKHTKIPDSKIGEKAIIQLYKIMIKHDSDKNNIIANVSGGSNNQELSPYISNENVKIAFKILKDLNIEILKNYTGGNRGKKVIFNNYTGEYIVDNISEWK